jgi:hypothetical protein
VRNGGILRQTIRLLNRFGADVFVPFPIPGIVIHCFFFRFKAGFQLDDPLVDLVDRFHPQPFANLHEQGGVKRFPVYEARVAREVLHVDVLRDLIHHLAIIRAAQVLDDQ